ncbi:MAG: hypothetical protein A2X64_02490 [Ignavibacteria bacterium GWF2_33_9]|nr:MAG: hypothetical protein A2X64_02490 [Ignavibacteria bacterium GWF2_33_9]
MEFTKEQLSTLVNDRHQIVIANAGSGKTTILVEKYLEIIYKLHPSEIDKIVAITFTKKAAAEMRERVISSINNAIDDLKHDNYSKETFFKEYKDLMEYREMMSSAKIQTIHSFCQEILKEYAVEAKVSPNFNLVDENLLEEMKIRFFNDTLEDFLVNENLARHKAKRFFNSVSQEKFRKIINLIFTNITIRNYFKENIENADSLDFEEKMNQQIQLQLIKMFNELVSEITKKFPDFYEINPDSSDIHALENRFKDGFDEIYNLSFINFIDELKAIWDKIDTAKIKGNLKIKNQLYQPKIYENFQKILKSMEESIYIDNLFELNQFIWSFYLAYEERLEIYKYENSYITYDDMLNKVYYILQNEDIAEKISSKYTYFLIDEFQDTDGIQYEIINRLISGNKNISNIFSNTINLFIVGDPKQSIYGFRKADVRVMNKAETDIIERNKHLFNNKEIRQNVTLNLKNKQPIDLTLSDTENFGKIELTISHRLNLINTVFVNSIFSNLLKKSNFEYSIGYNPFIFSRKNPFLNEIQTNTLLPEIKEDSWKFGNVQFLINLEPANNNEEYNNGNDGLEEQQSDNDDEAALTAKYINYLVHEENYIMDFKTGEKKRIVMSDIGILVRKRNIVDKLMRNLDYYNIPYFLNDSKNFFETQEVIDIISFIKFFNDNNDLWLASILKSNFFGFSDEEIFKIRNSNKNISLWETFEKYLIENNTYKYRRAFEIINYYKKNYVNIPVNVLLAEIIERTNFMQTFVNHPSKITIQSNINKFLKFIQRIVQRGITSYKDLLTEIEKSYEHPADIDDEIELAKDAVNLLTIHKSKGLEFPVVILYNLNSKGNTSDGIYFDDNFGVQYKFNYLSKDSGPFEINLPTLEIAKQIENEKGEEEEKRVLYVAATRAKDLLIMTSSLSEINKVDKRGKEKVAESTISNVSGMLKIILQGMNLNEKEFYNLVKNKYFSKETVVSINHKNEEKELAFSYSIPFITEVKDVTSNSFTHKSYKISKLLLEEIENSFPVFQNSATKIQSFLHHQKDYAQKYILQFPNSLQEDNFTSNFEISPVDRGTIIHFAMQNISDWINNDFQIEVDVLNEVLFNELENMQINLSKNIFEEIKSEILSVTESKFIQENLPSLLNAEHEVELYMPFEGDFIKIIIDVLIKTALGDYEIWDWKSNIINSKQEFEEKAKYYEFQMKYYAMVVSFLFPNQEKYIARLIFTRLASKNPDNNTWIAKFEWTKEDITKFKEDVKSYFQSIHNPQEMYKILIDNP